MIENIDNLNESELLTLKSEIDEQLKVKEQNRLDLIKRKDSVKNKTKICELTQNDRMFGIGLSSNDLEVYFMDYCDVNDYNDKEISNYHNISVGHKTKPFGISTSIHKKRINKHYFLSLSKMKSGYDLFFTLKPETWEEDLQEALEYKLRKEKKHFNKEIKFLKKKVKYIIKDKDKINNYITNNCL